MPAWHRDGPLARPSANILHQVAAGYEDICFAAPANARWRTRHPHAAM